VLRPKSNDAFGGRLRKGTVNVRKALAIREADEGRNWQSQFPGPGRPRGQASAGAAKLRARRTRAPEVAIASIATSAHSTIRRSGGVVTRNRHIFGGRARSSSWVAPDHAQRGAGRSSPERVRRSSPWVMRHPVQPTSPEPLVAARKLYDAIVRGCTCALSRQRARRSGTSDERWQ